jgi:L-lactate dehydrogenase complex protein LldE
VSIALFAPCFVDQLYPRVAIAALNVLERLGVNVEVPSGAVCCGQPPANAGFERAGEPALARFAHTFAAYDTTIVLSGSCAMHVRAHASSHGPDGERVAARSMEFCAFLHDVIGLERVSTLNAKRTGRAAVHVGCHALRGLGLAASSELHAPRFDKVRALLETVEGLTFATLTRPDECCGFGGSYSVTEPEVSVRMGRDRLRDYRRGDADMVVSTDVSCLMHLGGLAAREGVRLPMLHVAEVLAGPPQVGAA